MTTFVKFKYFDDRIKKDADILINVDRITAIVPVDKNHTKIMLDNDVFTFVIASFKFVEGIMKRL